MFDYIVTGSSGFLGTNLVRNLESSGRSVLSLDLKNGYDLSNSATVEKIFKSNSARNLVNLFAINDKFEGVGFNSTFLELDLEVFRRTIEVNITSLFSVCREFIRNNQCGNIVNFSSIYGVQSPDPRIYSNGEKPISYGVSKAGVLQLSRHLAIHSAPNFRVNTVVLGGIYENQDVEFVAKYEQKVPLLRMGLPHEIFGAVEFLTSESSSYITGAALHIDGGVTSW